MRIKPGFAADTVLVWASGHPAGALAVAVAPPFLMTTIRFTLAAALMALVALVTSARPYVRGRFAGAGVSVLRCVPGAETGGPRR
ncbi:hypothetical protein GCM10022267_18370 [Lentzea roselyniae]|uniref:Uncharacterized protein n=1 Tax=Lentzea roselyniae TaxID=531940 RepID=A0ABP7AH93_9PSEU